MGRLIYSAITSLDGYVEDDHGGFDWAAPDDEVHAFVDELERPVGTYLYGRRMYETMGELFGAAACEAGRRSYVNASLRSVRAGDSYFTTHLTPSRPDIEREQVDHRLTTGRPTSSSPRQQSDSGLSPNCSSWCSPDSRALRERLPLGHDERAGPAPRAAVRRTGGEARRAHARTRARARLAPCPSWKGSASPSRAVVARGLLASPLGMREDDCPGDSTLAQASVR